MEIGRCRARQAEMGWKTAVVWACGTGRAALGCRKGSGFATSLTSVGGMSRVTLLGSGNMQHASDRTL